MKPPVQCVLWEKPGLVGEWAFRERFERLQVFEEDEHLKRSLLKCRECGQLYFFEFYEEIAWEDGDDPSYVTFVPVETAVEIGEMQRSTPHGLLAFRPRLVRDHPKGAKTPTIGWIGKAAKA